MVTVFLLLLLSAFSPPVHSRLSTFHVIQYKMNQTEARTACRKNYTDLVTMYSDKDHTELTEVMKQAGVREGWLGLSHSQYSEKWSNGDPVTFNNLQGNCGTSCCAAMAADGKWDSIKCTEPKYFMCYEQGDNKAKLNYHLILENKNWYEAQRYCRRNYTDLVSIKDQQQNEEVKKGRQMSNVPFWIGLLRDDWQWADGGNSAYRNWGNGEPRPLSSPPSHCVKLFQGKWFTASCTSSEYPLCYNSTYIHVSDEALSWEKALDYCNEGNRAGILSIESKTDQDDVESALRNRVFEPVWVGLRQSILFGFWIWTNGNTVYTYSNWDEGKEPEHQLSQHCGAVDPQRNFKWRDMNCLSHFRALCHIKCPQ